MKKSVGSLIRAARTKADLDRATVAKKLKISAGYLGHLENDSPVTLSPRVVEALAQVLGVKIPAAMAERHNTKSTKYYRAYHAARKGA